MRMVSETRKHSPSRQPAAVAPHFKGTLVRLSRDAHVCQQIARKVQRLSCVRHQRISTVRQKLRSGQYEIDSRHLMQLILEAAQDTRSDYCAAA